MVVPQKLSCSISSLCSHDLICYHAHFWPACHSAMTGHVMCCLTWTAQSSPVCLPPFFHMYTGCCEHNRQPKRLWLHDRSGQSSKMAMHKAVKGAACCHSGRASAMCFCPLPGLPSIISSTLTSCCSAAVKGTGLR